MNVTWTSQLGSIARDQLPYAIAQAVNELAKEAAEDLQAEARESLNVRNRTFLRFFIRGPSPRATKAKPTARVFVGAPKTAKPDRGNMLVQHDAEGTNLKKPFSRPALMVPSKQYLSESRSRPRKWKEYKRDLRPASGDVGKGLMAIGRRFRTYLIRAKVGRSAGQLLLFTRTGKQSSELLYSSRPSVLLPKRLHSRDVVRKRIQSSAAKVVGRELTKAIASAKAITKGGGVTSTRLPNG